MPSAPLLTAVVADGQPLFRAGLARAFESRPNLRLVAETGDGRAALDLVREHRPHLALLDLALPSLDGLAVLAAVCRERLPTRVVLLSAAFGDEAVLRAVNLGVGGLLSKRAEAAEVCDALIAIGRGEQVIDRRLGDVARRENRRFARDDETPLLTTREREVLQLMAEGMSGPQIARELIVSPSTVKSHTENLYAKLGVSHRGAAVAEGMRRGLLR